MARTHHIEQPASTNARQTALLIAGDIITFVVFAAIGRRSHGEAAGFEAILQVLETAAPFMIGWFVVSPFVGAFKREIVLQPRSMATRTALAWLLALPIGLVLRALIRNTGIPTSFAVVTFLVVLVLLGGWRTIFAWRAAQGGRRGN
jgi:hypothetical protein